MVFDTSINRSTNQYNVYTQASARLQPTLLEEKQYAEVKDALPRDDTAAALYLLFCAAMGSTFEMPIV